MKTCRRYFRFRGMKKDQDFIIYPCLPTDNIVLLQSDTRIMRANLSNKTAVLSRSFPNGAYVPDLDYSRGAKSYVLSNEEYEAIKAMRDEMSSKTNSDRTIVLVGGKDA